MRKLIPFVLLLATACGDDVTAVPSARAFSGPPDNEGAVDAKQGRPVAGGAQSSAPVNIAAAEVPKKFIRNADLRVLVKNVEQASRQADSLIKKLGGDCRTAP